MENDLYQKFFIWDADNISFTKDMLLALNSPILLGLSKDGFSSKNKKTKPIPSDFDPKNVFHIYEACWQLRNELQNRKGPTIDADAEYSIAYLNVLFYHYISKHFYGKIDYSIPSIPYGERILGMFMANIRIIRKSNNRIYINIDN